MSNLVAELARFDGNLPIAVAQTPPASWYTTPEVLELERRAVFRATWQPVARLDQLAEPGCFVAGELVGEPWVVVRDAGELRAHFNVCRHHASCLVHGEGRLERFVCPYHGWTYDLDGRLRTAPRMAGVEAFDRNALGLVGMEVAMHSGLAWIRLERRGPGLDVVLRPIADRLSIAGLRHVERRSYEIACNWKVYVDNYLDGGYHVAHLHKGLAGQLDLDSYRTELHDWMAIQSCGAGSGGGGAGDFPERLAGGALYAWLYPNFMINRYGPIMDTNWVLPIGAERTLTVFDYWFDESCDDAFIERSLEASHRVQLEDVAICEDVQRGLRSSAYDTGRYAPGVEQAEYLFHRLLARDLGRMT